MVMYIKGCTLSNCLLDYPTTSSSRACSRAAGQHNATQGNPGKKIGLGLANDDPVRSSVPFFYFLIGVPRIHRGCGEGVGYVRKRCGSDVGSQKDILSQMVNVGGRRYCCSLS